MKIWCLLGVHDWVIIRSVTVTTDLGDKFTRYHLKCVTCGSVKAKNME